MKRSNYTNSTIIALMGCNIIALSHMFTVKIAPFLHILALCIAYVHYGDGKWLLENKGKMVTPIQKQGEKKSEKCEKIARMTFWISPWMALLKNIPLCVPNFCSCARKLCDRVLKTNIYFEFTAFLNYGWGTSRVGKF